MIKQTAVKEKEKKKIETEKQKNFKVSIDSFSNFSFPFRYSNCTSHYAVFFSSIKVNKNEKRNFLVVVCFVLFTCSLAVPMPTTLPLAIMFIRWALSNRCCNRLAEALQRAVPIHSQHLINCWMICFKELVRKAKHKKIQFFKKTVFFCCRYSTETNG